MMKFKIRYAIATLCAVFALAPVHADKTTTSGFDIENYAGQVVYLDFWASWCAPCRASFPFMNDLAAQFEDQGLRIVAVNVDSKSDDAAKFLEAIPADFDVMYDPAGVLAKERGLIAMPTSYLFDRQGRLVGSHAGFRKKDTPSLTNKIRTLLAQP